MRAAALAEGLYNIGLIADEITPMRPVKCFQLLRETNYSTTLDDKMVKNFSSADGRKTQAHEIQ